jgi:hypothetical protein
MYGIQAIIPLISNFKPFFRQLCHLKRQQHPQRNVIKILKVPCRFLTVFSSSQAHSEQFTAPIHKVKGKMGSTHSYSEPNLVRLLYG